MIGFLYYSYGYGGLGFSQETLISIMLMIGIALAGMFVQMRLKQVFARNSEIPFPGGMTGAEVAEKMLRDHNIYDVQVVHTGGLMTDHYNPTTKTVNLSDSVYSSCSITAAAVAAHECGHAVQHAYGYAPLSLRSALVPVVQFASSISSLVIIIGIIVLSTTNNATLCWIGIALIACSALFSIITLPVEYNASARAMQWLQSSRTLRDEQLDNAGVTLRWAARTYLVAAISAIITVLYYVSLILRRND
jgi:Zn-dependent membrane protease YugP